MHYNIERKQLRKQELKTLSTSDDSGKQMPGSLTVLILLLDGLYY